MASQVIHQLLCAIHRTEDMIKNPNKRCIIDDCKEIALYGETFQIHCEEHMINGEFNFVENNCSNCGLLNVLNNKNLCSPCGDFKFKRLYLVKQKEVKTFLDLNEMKYELYDKAIDRNCGLERPDFLFDAVTHKVILEVDENQHSNYDCERVRMINISQTLGMPVIFLRYNPDKFKGIEISNHTRQAKLLEWINYCFTLRPSNENEFLREIKLFYNGYKEGNVEIKNIEIPL